VGAVRLAKQVLMVVMQNSGDFVYVILLRIDPLIQLISAFVISGSHTSWYHGTFSKVE
jgi:hypothetical protein